MHIVPYQPEHLDALLLQPNQAYMRGFLGKPEYRQLLNVPGKAFSAVHDGQVYACAGLVMVWQGRAEAWALMAPDLRKHFLTIHNATLRFLTSCAVPRVEANVDEDFGCARRWIEMLGFSFEGKSPKFTPDGRTVLRYARVQ